MCVCMYVCADRTLFMVRVPVLSEQRMDIAAMSSIAARRVTMAPTYIHTYIHTW